MISKTMPTVLLVVVAFALTLGASGQTCSNSSFTGSYGFAGAGTNASGNPVAVSGLYIANGTGKITGTRTESVNGVISTAGISGTYTITSSCNGSAKITPKGSATEHYQLTLASSGTRVFSLQTDPGTIMAVYGRATEVTTCTNGSATFGFTGSGSILGVGDIVDAGQMTFDGAGHLSGTESSSIAGAIQTNVPFTGTYKLNANCAGSATLKIKGQLPTHFNFVLVRQEASMFFVDTDANTIVAGWDRE